MGRHRPLRGVVGFAPFAQSPGASTTFVIRTSVPTNELSYAVSKAVHAIDPGISLTLVYPLISATSTILAATRFSLFLFGVFACWPSSSPRSACRS